jgi:HK97 family phage prohead protease
VDRYNEVIDQAGWQLDNFRANPVIPDCHNYDSVARILGRALSVEVRGGKLVNQVEFCLDNPMGALAHKMAKGGFLKSQSVGFIPLEWQNGKGADQPDRTFTKCELLEISMVVVPANPGATLNIKSAYQAGAIAQADIKNAVDFLKQFCSDQTDPGHKAGTSEPEILDVQLLQIARGLRDVLKK